MSFKDEIERYNDPDNWPETSLPADLQEDIANVINKKDDPFYDVYLDQLYGTINMYQHAHELPKTVADYLRKKYLGE